MHWIQIHYRTESRAKFRLLTACQKWRILTRQWPFLSQDLFVSSCQPVCWKAYGRENSDRFECTSQNPFCSNSFCDALNDDVKALTLSALDCSLILATIPVLRGCFQGFSVKACNARFYICSAQSDRSRMNLGVGISVFALQKPIFRPKSFLPRGVKFVEQPLRNAKIKHWKTLQIWCVQ